MKPILIAVTILVLFSSSPATADSFWDRFKDPQDGKFDVSGWSEGDGPSIGGLLPIPVIISEPAIGGLGLGVGVAYLREKKPANNAGQTGGDGKAERKRPPSISGVAGAYSLNDSWLIGGGHSDNWLDDSLRYMGALGYASINLDFYGIGPDGLPSDTSLPFNIDGLMLYQDLNYRLFNSDFFLGGRYIFSRTDVTFDIGKFIPGVPESHLVSDDAGLGPTLLYDTRDNIFTPTRGGKAEVSAILHDPAVGGDFNYQMYNAKGMAWLPVHSAVTLALRLDGSLSEGDAPFYTLPFIMLRGIPAMRYQDEVAVMGEVEARWQISARWSVLGFTGAGRAADTVDELGSATSRHTVGTGFRYLIARKFGMHSGVDVARGPDGTYAYLMVGSAF